MTIYLSDFASVNNPMYGNKLLSWEVGVGPSGSYVPNIGDAQYKAAGVSLKLFSGAMSRDGAGWLTSSVASTWCYFTLPAKTSDCRRYIYNIKFTATTAYPDRFQFHLNTISTADTWYCRVIWHSSNFISLVIYDVDGSEVSKATNNFTSSIGLPLMMTVVVNDYGDLVTMAVEAYETDTNGDADSKMVKWYAASRRNASVSNGGFQIVDSNGAIALHSIEILDVPDL